MPALREITHGRALREVPQGRTSALREVAPESGLTWPEAIGAFGIGSLGGGALGALTTVATAPFLGPFSIPAGLAVSGAGGYGIEQSLRGYLDESGQEPPVSLAGAGGAAALSVALPPALRAAGRGMARIPGVGPAAVRGAKAIGEGADWLADKAIYTPLEKTGKALTKAGNKVLDMPSTKRKVAALLPDVDLTFDENTVRGMLQSHVPLEEGALEPSAIKAFDPSDVNLDPRRWLRALRSTFAGDPDPTVKDLGQRVVSMGRKQAAVGALHDKYSDPIRKLLAELPEDVRLRFGRDMTDDAIGPDGLLRRFEFDPTPEGRAQHEAAGLWKDLQQRMWRLNKGKVTQHYPVKLQRESWEHLRKAGIVTGKFDPEKALEMGLDQGPILYRPNYSPQFFKSPTGEDLPAMSFDDFVRATQRQGRGASSMYSRTGKLTGADLDNLIAEGRVEADPLEILNRQRNQLSSIVPMAYTFGGPRKLTRIFPSSSRGGKSIEVPQNLADARDLLVSQGKPHMALMLDDWIDDFTRRGSSPAEQAMRHVTGRVGQMIMTRTGFTSAGEYFKVLAEPDSRVGLAIARGEFGDDARRAFKNMVHSPMLDAFGDAPEKSPLGFMGARERGNRELIARTAVPTVHRIGQEAAEHLRAGTKLPAGLVKEAHDVFDGMYTGEEAAKRLGNYVLSGRQIPAHEYYSAGMGLARRRMFDLQVENVGRFMSSVGGKAALYLKGYPGQQSRMFVEDVIAPIAKGAKLAVTERDPSLLALGVKRLSKYYGTAVGVTGATYAANHFLRTGALPTLDKVLWAANNQVAGLAGDAFQVQQGQFDPTDNALLSAPRQLFRDSYRGVTEGRPDLLTKSAGSWAALAGMPNVKWFTDPLAATMRPERPHRGGSRFDLSSALGAFGPSAAYAEEGGGEIMAKKTDPVIGAARGMTGDELTKVAQTIFMEAASEPYEGKLAVGYSIVNRARDKQGRWPRSPGAVATQRNKRGVWQYSAWGDPKLVRRALAAPEREPERWRASVAAARAALGGREPDPTGGANHYLNIPVTMKIRGGSLPSWYEPSKVVASIKRHTFLRL